MTAAIKIIELNTYVAFITIEITMLSLISVAYNHTQLRYYYYIISLGYTSGIINKITQFLVIMATLITQTIVISIILSDSTKMTVRKISHIKVNTYFNSLKIILLKLLSQATNEVTNQTTIKKPQVGYLSVIFFKF